MQGEVDGEIEDGGGVRRGIEEEPERRGSGCKVAGR